MLALQRRAGNDAVRTLAEGPVVVQRQLPFLVPALIGLAGYGAYKALGGGGGEPAPTPAATPTPDPVLQALAEQAWQNDVRKPIFEAYNALAGPRPDYDAALNGIGRAYHGVYGAMNPLPKGDPRIPDGNYVIDDLRIAGAHVAAKLGTGTDKGAADLLKRVYDEAEAFGQKLGVVTMPTTILSATSGEGGS